MNQQHPSVLGSSPEACALTFTHQQVEDIRDALGDTLWSVTQEGHSQGSPAFHKVERQITLMMRLNTVLKALAMILVAVCCLTARAQNHPTVYVEGPEDFSTALTAALNKKHVPVQVTLEEKQADYVLHVGGLQTKTESGGSQVARCLFMDCIGAFGSSSVSVNLVKQSSSNVLWAYQVRKGMGGPMGIQSMSEAIAKHLKKDYFKEK